MVHFFHDISYTDSARAMPDFEDRRERYTLRVRRLRETCLRLTIHKADDVGSVIEDGEGVREMGLVGEFSVDVEFPFKTNS